MGDFFIEEEQRMLHSLEVFEPRMSPSVRNFILEAYSAEDWDWRESDGCTAVDERFWPSKYFPPCMGHDYTSVLSTRATNRAEADRIRKRGDILFYKANRAYGLPLFGYTFRGIRNSAGGRFFGVRLWWWLVGRRKIPK